MTFLPVITGFGGINPAGRSSFHHGFSRLVFDILSGSEQDRVLTSLAHLTGRGHRPLDATLRQQLLEGTLIREIGSDYFDLDAVPAQSRADLRPGDGPVVWRMRRRELPHPLPAGWSCHPIDDDLVEITATAATAVLMPTSSPSRVRAAGQLPGGFDPATRYPSKHHPRGLQMAIYAASDAIKSLGIDWNSLMNRVAPEQVALYASSAMGQLDDYGGGGMMQYPMTGRRTTSKQCPFSLAEMPADFVNAYVLGSLGSTGGILGACATFLFNLEKAVHDIQAGRIKLAVVGSAEAPILPEIIEGYRVMGALAQDEDLMALDGLTEGAPDYRRACRPFANNCGFTLGESAQYLVLMADDLALATGATLLGAVPGVFINADGFKKSISAPGAGNYLTLGRAAALTESLLGQRGLREHSLLHAHGTGTPQNRTTESHVFDTVARAFGITDWQIAATKCYVGHSLGPAAGDQIGFALGSLASGIVPGIATVERFADDVHKQRLRLSQHHRQDASDHWQASLINSKGFGGNNATGVILSGAISQHFLEQRHGKATLNAWRRANEAVEAERAAYESDLLRGNDQAVYQFGHGVLEGGDIDMSNEEIRLPNRPAVSLKVANPYGRMT